MQNTICASASGMITGLKVSLNQQVEEHQVLLTLSANQAQETSAQIAELQPTINRWNDALSQRIAKTLDDNRQPQRSKRHQKGANTARENIARFCSSEDFVEFGQFAVAAQRKRRDYQQLQSDTAADGVITGLAKLNRNSVASDNYDTALIINDYSVLAGTQGYFHHMKLDRMIRTIEKRRIPAIMLTEGGGGRPGDTDINSVISGLQCTTFSRWAGLKGVVPRIAVANGYNFAGNAALFGAADIRIATQSANIGMAGPAMIEGGGLGTFSPLQIGPAQQQCSNGVIDILVENEDQAIEKAKQCLGYFQGDSQAHLINPPDAEKLDSVLPDDRRFVYDMHLIIDGVTDTASFTELQPLFGKAVIIGFGRIEGKTVGILASNCKHLGGAIDVDAASKLDTFMQLCNQFSIPLVSFCDTPGFMVGPDHEQRAAVTRLAKLFSTGAQLTVPFYAVVVRKCYGLGAQAMLAGSTLNPECTLSWPQGEFGAMGLEGAIKLGFKQELEAISEPQKRQALFDKLVAKAYQQGQAMEVASMLEIDAVIRPSETRKTLLQLLG